MARQAKRDKAFTGVAYSVFHKGMEWHYEKYYIDNGILVETMVSPKNLKPYTMAKLIHDIETSNEAKDTKH